MKKATSSLIIAAIAILSLTFSCIETDLTLGADLLPEDQFMNTKQITFDLPVSLKIADSIATTSSTSIVFGAFNTEKFGLSEFSSATTFAPASDSATINVGTNRRFKKFELKLQLRRIEGLDSRSDNIIQNVYVHRMVKSFDSTTVYNCSLTEDFYESEPISINSPVYTGGDTLTIQLSEEYATRILDSLYAHPDIVDTTSNFNKMFPGLYFRVDAPMTGVNEGRINNFKVQSYARLSYTADFGDRKDVDTTIVFQTGLTSDKSSYYFVLNQSRFSSQHLETDNAENGIYVEGNAGIKPVISSSYLTETISKWAESEGIDIEKLMLVRANLRLPFEFPDDIEKIDDLYPTTLSPSVRIHTEEDNMVLYSTITDVNVSDENPGDINRSTGCYTPDITHYLQRMLKKGKDELSVDDDIWLMPTTKDQDSNDSSSSTDNYNMYNYYNPYYYYDPYGSYGYGGYYGYGYGGYGGYYGYNPYGYYSSSLYGSSSEDESQLTLDSISHFEAELNGTSKDSRPKLVITYCVLPEAEK